MHTPILTKTQPLVLIMTIFSQAKQHELNPFQDDIDPSPDGFC